MPIITESTTPSTTAVILGTVWLNVADDPTDFLSLPTMSSLSVTTEKSSEVRRLANGRLRTITRAGGPRRRVAVSATYVTRAEVEWLEEHVGVLLCVRDDRGRKVFGVYHTVQIDEHRGIEDGGVSLSVDEVTYSEAV